MIIVINCSTCYRKRNRNTDPEKKCSSNEHGEDNLLCRSNQKNHLLTRRFSRERSSSIERIRCRSAQDRSPQ